MLTARITNFVTTGAEMIEDGARTSRRLIPLCLNGDRVSIKIDREYIARNTPLTHPTQNHCTATVEIESAQEADEEVWILCLQVLCELLGFATVSRVGLHSVRWEESGASRAFATAGSIETFRPVFADGKSIGDFVTQVFSNYVGLRSKRELNVAIDYLANIAVQGIAMEMKLIGLFVLLEHLKYTWAKDQGFPYIGGYFRLHGASAARPGKKQTFRELADGMFSAVGMPPTPKDFIDLRNEIIHSGLLAISGSGKMSLMERLVGTHREYLLRLVGFSGSFYDFSSGRQRPIP